MSNEKGSVSEVLYAAATIALWLRVEGADIGLVQLVRATRVIEAELRKVKEAINNTQ